jgi:NDP-sugar pyrophosphorylase family protein
LNGDTYFPVNLIKLLEFHSSKPNNNLTLALKYIKNITRSGSVIVDENNKILSFDEKKEKPE